MYKIHQGAQGPGCTQIQGEAGQEVEQEAGQPDQPQSCSSMEPGPQQTWL